MGVSSDHHLKMGPELTQAHTVHEVNKVFIGKSFYSTRNLEPLLLSLRIREGNVKGIFQFGPF